MDEPKTTKDEVNDGMIAALLHERQGYVQRAAGALDATLAAAMRSRVAQVDEQLRLRGGTPPKDTAADAAEAEENTDPAKDAKTEPPKDAAAAGKRGQQTRA
jgi:hypothetical protein